jgi:hypothetical protein
MKKIPLTQGNFVLVDDADFEWLNKYIWRPKKTKYTYYARRRSKGKEIQMARQILNPPSHLHCDHINHNGLDNRRSNLRICTISQNQHNSKLRSDSTSGFKGVYWDRDLNKWRVRISINKKVIWLGSYTCLIEAAKVYDAAAIKYYKEFANLNFPERTEQ